MKYIILGLLIVIVFILAVMVILIKYNSDKLKDLMIKINEAEENINILVNKKIELILNINNCIEDKSLDIKVDNIDEITNKELNIYEQNRILNNCYNQILEIVDYNNNVILDDEEYKNVKRLKDISISLNGVQNYYNDNVNILNNYINKFPTNLITKSKKLKKRELFVNEKNEIFEILKNE